MVFIGASTNTVSIVFTHGVALVSKIIMWLTRSNVSHVMVEFTLQPFNTRWVAEATFFGVRLVPATRAYNPKKVVSCFNCNFDTIAGLKEAEKYIGELYDFEGIAVFGRLLAWWKLLKIKLRRPHRDTKQQFCSEFATRMLLACPGSGIKDLDPEFTSPSDLLVLCLSKPDQFIPTIV